MTIRHDWEVAWVALPLVFCHLRILQPVLNHLRILQPMLNYYTWGKNPLQPRTHRTSLYTPENPPTKFGDSTYRVSKVTSDMPFIDIGLAKVQDYWSSRVSNIGSNIDSPEARLWPPISRPVWHPRAWDFAWYIPGLCPVALCVVWQKR